MPTVNTVLGPVESSELGFTLSHEHVGTNAAGLRHTYPEFINRAGIIEQSAAALTAMPFLRAYNPPPHTFFQED